MVNSPVFIYLGTYADQAAARADYDLVKDLFVARNIGNYDAAVITKDDDGRVHIHKDEMATRHGAWNGAAVGAVLGILFPPALIATAIVGAAIGGVSGHLWKGLSRADTKELGEIIDDGQAALLVVGRGTLQQGLNTVEFNAKKSVTKQLDVDADDINAAIQHATEEIGWAEASDLHLS
jgi:uncharacterized membrane protein